MPQARVVELDPSPFADGAAIKDSFGILQRVTFHQQIIARLWRFL
jgi:hypothetical protein